MTLLVRWAALLILALAGLILWMKETEKSFDPPPHLPPHLSSPILAMELVRTSEDIRFALDDPTGWENRLVFRRLTNEDWPFILAYWLLFLSLAGILLRCRCRWCLARILAILVILTASAAALCDVFENLGILLVLDTDIGCLSDAMARSIRTPSLIKWGSFAAAALFAAPLFLSYRRGPILPGILTIFAGIAILIAGLLGLVGVFWNPAIEWSTRSFAPGLAAALLVFVFWPRPFLEAIGAEEPDERRRFRRLWSLAFLALLSFVGLLIVLAARTMSLRSAPEEVPAGPLVKVHEEGVTLHLRSAVHIETVSHPVPTDRETAQLAELRKYLALAYPNVRARLNWEEPNGNLLIIWEGSDRSMKPLLLLAHMDVVPASTDGTRPDGARPIRSRGPGSLGSGPSDGAPSGESSTTGEAGDWRALAFDADPEKTKPFIYGRGTLDDKVSIVGILEAVESLVLEGYCPRRTLVLAFGRDEEVGGKNGAVMLSGLLKSRGIKAECVIDEGSYVVHGFVPGFDGPIAPIGVAEKGYMNLELSVSAEGGHTSMPPPQTAIGILGRAISRLEDNPPPARIDGITGQTIRALGPELPFLPRLLLVNDWLFGDLLLWGLEKSPTTNAMIRTTSAVTLVRGGTKDNVLPDRASAIVNYRLLPGDNSRSILRYVRRVVDDPRGQRHLRESGGVLRGVRGVRNLFQHFGRLCEGPDDDPPDLPRGGRRPLPRGRRNGRSLLRGAVPQYLSFLAAQHGSGRSRADPRFIRTHHSPWINGCRPLLLSTHPEFRFLTRSCDRRSMRVPSRRRM
jgi:carboxypeptidase PM20D1